ncbi:hypothetical protein A5707_09000 [Mycobacterium kyorinense]|uniref:Uncharacterized protein n=1 Tax=Mycobacterium kyorinense TaxID=487514 RepID=A0A1A2YQM8_9MYCO|nr:hypothetical protein [Mycobacterium kyorinense]OBI40549.1 hypothetical protein A5707_09000 [Mycobacterium kyorinense]
MLGAIAIVPSAPVLVPELAGAAGAEVADLRAAVIAAAAALPPRWIAVGVGGGEGVIDASSVGTFAGFGAEVTVRLSPHGARDPVALPLCALFTGWVREQAQPDAHADVQVYRPDLDVDAALAVGRRLRGEVEAANDPIGVLVVADGANTLTAAAPGGYRPDDVDVQRVLDDALAGGDVAALTRLPDHIVGRVAFQVLAGLAEPAPRSAKELYRGAPYGVGYFAGIWQP